MQFSGAASWTVSSAPLGFLKVSKNILLAASFRHLTTVFKLHSHELILQHLMCLFGAHGILVLIGLHHYTTTPVKRYSLRTHKTWRLGQRHGLQNTILTACYYKNIYEKVVYIFLWKYFSRQIYSYNFYICKLNNLKVIDDLYSQYLTQTLSKTSSFIGTEGVHSKHALNTTWQPKMTLSAHTRP